MYLHIKENNCESYLCNILEEVPQYESWVPLSISVCKIMSKANTVTLIFGPAQNSLKIIQGKINFMMFRQENPPLWMNVTFTQECIWRLWSDAAILICHTLTTFLGRTFLEMHVDITSFDWLIFIYIFPFGQLRRFPRKLHYRAFVFIRRILGHLKKNCFSECVAFQCWFFS